MKDLQSQLSDIVLSPYIFKAMALIGVRRRGGGNMFRHQMATMAILLDYKMIDPILLKASVIHDLFEDAPNMPGVTKEEIIGIDLDGPAVFELVMEVTRRVNDGARESKADYLRRVMEAGSERAKLLKLADRISNTIALGFIHDGEFVRKSIVETRECILPFAKAINADMYRELSHLLSAREEKLGSRK